MPKLLITLSQAVADRIDAAAAIAHRTRSAEVEHRLIASFGGEPQPDQPKPTPSPMRPGRTAVVARRSKTTIATVPARRLKGYDATTREPIYELA